MANNLLYPQHARVVFQLDSVRKELGGVALCGGRDQAPRSNTGWKRVVEKKGSDD